jgi:hypothetical protein
MSVPTQDQAEFDLANVTARDINLLRDQSRAFRADCALCIARYSRIGGYGGSFSSGSKFGWSMADLIQSDVAMTPTNEIEVVSPEP